MGLSGEVSADGGADQERSPASRQRAEVRGQQGHVPDELPTDPGRRLRAV